MEQKDIDRIIEMAWEDRTPFEAIKTQFNFSEANVISLMRRELKRSSFNLWRKRVHSGISQKHTKKRNPEIDRFKSALQKSISMNKISKRWMDLKFSTDYKSNLNKPDQMFPILPFFLIGKIRKDFVQINKT